MVHASLMPFSKWNDPNIPESSIYIKYRKFSLADIVIKLYAYIFINLNFQPFEIEDMFLIGKNVFQWTNIICANVFTHKCDAKHQLKILIYSEHLKLLDGTGNPDTETGQSDVGAGHTVGAKLLCRKNTDGRSYNHSKFSCVYDKHTSLSRTDMVDPSLGYWY